MDNYFAFPLNTSPHEQMFSWWDNGFTHNEVKKIIWMGESFPIEVAKTSGATEEDGTNPDIRTATLSWIKSNEKTAWLYEKMFEQIRELNHKYYGFDLWGFESFQYTIYDATKNEPAFYDWHVDTIGGGAENRKPQRKLSATLQLSHPQEYEGGELWLRGKTETCIPKVRGALHVFPSYTLHRVTPVTSGVRRSLVAWAVGPEFK